MANSADHDQFCFFRSQLICIYTICKGTVYPGSAGQGLNSWKHDVRHINLHLVSGQIQQMTNWGHFSYFTQKIGSDISCKLSRRETCKLSHRETICMKSQILFSKKKYFKMSSAEIFTQHANAQRKWVLMVSGHNKSSDSGFVCVEVLWPSQPNGPCWAWSVYLTTLFIGQV